MYVWEKRVRNSMQVKYKKHCMKTNQEMIRYIGQYSVIQRTSDGFFDANSYLHSINGNSDCDSDIDEYVEQSIYGEYISKENGITYMPYFVFVDFALYIAKEFSIYAFTLCMSDEWREKRGLIGDMVDHTKESPAQNHSTQIKSKNMFHTYITNELNGLRKIGRSHDIDKRMNSMRPHNPLISCDIEICFDIESELHDIFKEQRFDGEWFRLSELDVRVIREASSIYKTDTDIDKILNYIRVKRKQYSKRNYLAVFQLQQENTNFIHYK